MGTYQDIETHYKSKELNMIAIGLYYSFADIRLPVELPKLIYVMVNGHSDSDIVANLLSDEARDIGHNPGRPDEILLIENDIVQEHWFIGRDY
jgi:hypothetical protein